MSGRIIYDYSFLRGKITEKFGSISKFADSLGLTQQSVSYKLLNKTSISQDDMCIWASALDIKDREFKKAFCTIDFNSI